MPAMKCMRMLFVAAKVSHLGYLPQGQPERYSRVLKMVEQMDKEGFGGPFHGGQDLAPRDSAAGPGRTP